ncbi:dihydroxyacetone kinase subunit L [Georgenia sp. TF02-10]|uniref:dihydroxyacetone kinase subunit DhaL n=1 Tax=Georgenia sp. TF02-10 TaxID=2917725 RepID=UPI001FA6BAAC|nr:dihydroxyacetone kinase subunit DhaL [Georgenia sp. TF02-10]UNX55878.1 dihydroxyacetone kinase subunit L [Georgenia sp. TF02-10]
MSATLGAPWALDWMARAAKVIAENRIELIELDRAIGDGDHGENLDRGFTAVTAKLDGASPATPGEVLKTVATTLMSSVGGAAGPLYGTAFLRGSKVADGDLDGAAVAALLEAGLTGIKARGKAEPGEKTMVDAWSRAAEAARAAADGGADPATVLRAAAEAAVAGSDATVDMVATKGRASYLGERSAGHRDPGAQSSALLLQAAAEAAEAAAGSGGAG